MEVQGRVLMEGRVGPGGEKGRSEWREGQVRVEGRADINAWRLWGEE